MRRDDSDFGGTIPGIVETTLSTATLGAGAALGLPIVAVSAVLLAAGAPRLVLPFTLVAASAALARFALNGLSGDRGGSLSSDVGGPWTLALAVALRFLALTSVWYAPLSLLGTISASSAVSPIAKVFGGAGIVGALTLVGLAFTPPVFLIVAASVENVADAFSGDVWRSRFRGRRSDLLLLYAVHAGSCGLLALAALPPLALARAIGPTAGNGAAALAACCVLGVSIRLLGRLCGLFASAAPAGVDEAELPVPAAQPAPVPPPTPVRPQAAPPYTTQAIPTAATAVPPGRLPALLAAKQRVDDALRVAEQDPDGALVRLRQLDADHAPHPLVLHALFMTALRAGRPQDAREAAERAIPVCVERGQASQAAEIFREMRAHRIEAPIGVEALLAIGQALVRMDDLATAAKAFTSVVTGDPQHTRAIKGLLEVADHILHRKHNPEAAAKVYRLVLTTCPHTPLTDFARAGLEAAERTIAGNR